MVQAYVRGRTESRTNINFKDIPRVTDDRGRPRIQFDERWRTTQENVAKDAFLQMRSRRQQQDFVEYFAGTICSVGQFLPQPDYAALAHALLADDDAWEDVRALAMIAVSTMVNVA
jgi:CRISPR-associated protein Cmx8